MLTPVPPRFGQLLKQLRARRDLTQEALAELAGCAVYTIRTYEMSTRRPSRDMAEHLANVLDLLPPDRDTFLKLARAPLDMSSQPSQGVVEPAHNEPIHHNRPALPAAPNTLVGRGAELADLSFRLSNPNCRLLTILGPGGVGKTRLALQLASDLQRAGFGEEVIWVELAPLMSAAQLPAALAAALGTTAGAVDQTAYLLDLLRPRRALLVLDNMEHLLDGAGLLALILREAPEVRLLVTSRERLRIQGEWVYELDGLAMPGEGLQAARAASVLLFLERARQVDHSFVLSSSNLPAVTRICRMLVGIPLAVELAAAWVRVLPCEAIADEIERNLDFLTDQGRDTMPRHASLRAVFTHSWRLLAEPERRALARLSLLRGTWDREAAAVVAQAEAPALAALIDTALVRRVGASADARFMLHELVRQYAGEQLQSDPAEAVAASARHAQLYANRLNRLVGSLQSSAQSKALAHLSPELDNIWSAWAWAVENRDASLLREMSRGIVTICEDLGRVLDGARLLGEAVVASDGNTDPSTRGVLLSWHGYFLGRCGQPAAAEQQLHTALSIIPPGENRTRGQVYAHLALLGYQQGRYAEASAWAGMAAGLLLTAGDTFYHGLAVCFIGMIGVATGDPAAAAQLEHSAALWRENGYPRGIALTLLAQSRLALSDSKTERSLALAGEALQLSAHQRDRWGVAIALLHLGRAALAGGDMIEAGYLFAESAEAAGEVGEQWVRCQALVGVGRAAAACGKHAAALEALQSAIRLGRGIHLLPMLLEALLGLVLLHADRHLTDALRWLTYVCQHSATDALVRAEAERHRAHLTVLLGKDIVEDQPLSSASLDDVLNEVLRTARG